MNASMAGVANPVTAGSCDAPTTEKRRKGIARPYKGRGSILNRGPTKACGVPVGIVKSIGATTTDTSATGEFFRHRAAQRQPRQSDVPARPGQRSEEHTS